MFDLEETLHRQAGALHRQGRLFTRGGSSPAGGRPSTGRGELFTDGGGSSPAGEALHPRGGSSPIELAAGGGLFTCGSRQSSHGSPSTLSTRGSSDGRSRSRRARRVDAAGDREVAPRRALLRERSVSVILCVGLTTLRVADLTERELTAPRFSLSKQESSLSTKQSLEMLRGARPTL